LHGRHGFSFEVVASLLPQGKPLGKLGATDAFFGASYQEQNPKGLADRKLELVEQSASGGGVFVLASVAFAHMR